jgi:non-heme chloroperoxidase
VKYWPRVLAVIGVLLLIASVAAQTPSPSRGSALPAFVDVADGVRLEVVDWGGRGRTVVFLSGTGNTAHVFDQFAPRFTDEFRVIGITRRGFGASSRPATGYRVLQLADDLGAALDSLKLDRPILVGHSLAGEEMSVIAARQPNRVGGLVYLDAAYDRTQPDVMRLMGQLPPLPKATKGDLVSRNAFQAFWLRTHGWTYPASELDQYDRYGDPPPDVEQAIVTSFESPHYERITAPALAIYALPRSGKEMFAAYDLVDKSAQSRVDAVWPTWVSFVRSEEQRFRTRVRNGRTLEIPGASHYVFLTNPNETAHAVRGFLEELARNR